MYMGEDPNKILVRDREKTPNSTITHMVKGKYCGF